MHAPGTESFEAEPSLRPQWILSALNAEAGICRESARATPPLSYWFVQCSIGKASAFEKAPGRSFRGARM